MCIATAAMHLAWAHDMIRDSGRVGDTAGRVELARGFAAIVCWQEAIAYAMGEQEPPRSLANGVWMEVGDLMTKAKQRLKELP
jgi:hypothetical protein